VHSVRPGLGDDAVRDALHPGHHQAVLEAEDQLHAYQDAAAQALHDAHELGSATVAQRHEVDEPHGAVSGLEVGLQDQRALAVAARHAADLAHGSDEPAAVPLLSQQRGKARRGVEAGQAQPVHRAVTADQGGGLQITDQRVLLDLHRNSFPVLLPLLQPGPVWP
jgi:hypothetical protein